MVIHRSVAEPHSTPSSILKNLDGQLAKRRKSNSTLANTSFNEWTLQTEQEDENLFLQPVSTKL